MPLPCPTSAPSASAQFPVLTAPEAAALIQHGDTLGFSGFTPAGTPKAVSRALALRAQAEHAAGNPFQVGVVTGASTGPSVDGALAAANAISFRTPYQSDPNLRQRINSGETHFFDMHLSMLPQNVRYGFLGKFSWAIIEASDVTADGQIVLTSAVGAAPTFCRVADRIIIELNRHHPAALRGFHDIYEPVDPPHRSFIPVFSPSDRAGTPYIRVDPKKIAGVVFTDLPDETAGFEDPTPVTTQIGQNVANFLASELRRGAIPPSFLPLQSGVGNIANAVLGSLGAHPDIPKFSMYTEVIQDSVIELMRSGKIEFASGVSLTVSPTVLASIYKDLPAFRSRLLLRPQEISNHPEVVRRLGLISINTAIEADLFGNINSTHILGRNLVNGIGGSGDFTRNAFLSIFTCPSTAKGGKISTIVPLVSHMDHSEHSVQILVTEQGVADLRGKDPCERMHLIIEKCAHPDFRDELRRYAKLSEGGHTPQTLANAFAMHQQLLRTGSMRGVTWNE
ncbi:acetyl-CoA hydrolase [Nibricoccus aquaticus]|uniref:Acetyl-CoA hydrolase n=1 Tax=Nibricoccus aquaticus TaxID=2576891 RepID=A0A290QB18_9BACT|nr:acetyl-CoA hydrolase/transferase family protein [Nibricoccus aquaticus]ATC65724.1 acetyl-CoA hydrolase [Nibricoccus aquaticus]